MFYLPTHAFVYELRVEMHLIVTSFVLWANISPAQGDASCLINQNFTTSQQSTISNVKIFFFF